MNYTEQFQALADYERKYSTPEDNDEPLSREELGYLIVQRIESFEGWEAYDNGDVIEFFQVNDNPEYWVLEEVTEANYWLAIEEYKGISEYCEG